MEKALISNQSTVHLVGTSVTGKTFPPLLEITNCSLAKWATSISHNYTKLTWKAIFSQTN